MVKLNPRLGTLPAQKILSKQRLLALTGKDAAVRLDYNENQFGACPQVKQAVAKVDPCCYPEYRSTELLSLLAKRHGIYEDQIYLANGSDAILDAVPVIMCASEGSEAIIPGLTYERFQKSCQVHGVKPVFVPLLNYEIDLDVVLAAITHSTGIIYLVNPNMPTGTVKSAQQIRDFMAKVPNHVLVVLDQAYVDFIDDPRAALHEGALVKDYSNLMVVRTFSKYFGLAGCRIGYFFASDVRIVDAFSRAYQAMPVNQYAIAAGIAALQNLSWYREHVYEPCLQNRGHFIKGMQALGLPVVRSQGNFVYFPTAEVHWDNADVQLFLMRTQGIVTRTIHDFGLRITVGQKRDMDGLLDGLKNYAASHVIRR